MTNQTRNSNDRMNAWEVIGLVLLAASLVTGFAMTIFAPV
jgi:hypothetical protein